MLIRHLCQGKALTHGGVHLWLSGLSSGFEEAASLLAVLSSRIPSSLSERVRMLDQNHTCCPSQSRFFDHINHSGYSLHGV